MTEQEATSKPVIRAIFQARGRHFVELDASIVDFLGIDAGQIVEQRIGKDGILLRLMPPSDKEEREEEESKEE